MGTPIDLFTLTRPLNSAMVGFAVIVGVAVTAPLQILSGPSVLGFLTGFLISAYSMVVNDYYDHEVDIINAPNRPIASGRVSPRAATVYAVILLALGIALSTPLGGVNLVIAAFFASFAWLYNHWGKKQILLGNTMVAASVAIPYIYGGAAVGKTGEPLLWFLALTSFLAATGREVVKTISDIKGDEVRNIRSIARVYGGKSAAALGATLFLGAVASTAIPIIAGEVGTVFVQLILIPDALFIYAAVWIIRDSSAVNSLRIKSLTLMGMVMGMLVFIAGGMY